MMNAGNKRLILLLLALSMLVCGVIGGTLALNDSNDTMDYNVKLLCYNPDTKEYDLPLYGESAYSPFATDVVWCPGYTEIVYLKLTNGEAFPVDCELDIVVKENGFGKTLSYAVIYGMQPTTKGHPTNWVDFKAKANISKTLENSSYTVTSKVELDPGDRSSRYYALAIHMDENATNEYKNVSMEMNFLLNVTAEKEPGSTPSND